MRALGFLESIAGVTRAKTDGSADRPNRLATVDPAYTYGDGSARVTFDGESTMSTKLYPILGNSYPIASGRVMLLPVGTTYVIAGPISWTAQLPSFAEDSTTQTFTGTTAAAGSPVVGVSFTAPPSGKVSVTITGYIDQDVNTEVTVLGWELRDGGTIGSGTILYSTASTRSVVAGNAINTGAPAQESSSNTYGGVTGLTPGSAYNARAMHLVSAGGTGHAYFRSVRVEPIMRL